MKIQIRIVFPLPLFSLCLLNQNMDKNFAASFSINFAQQNSFPGDENFSSSPLIYSCELSFRSFFFFYQTHKRWRMNREDRKDEKSVFGKWKRREERSWTLTDGWWKIILLKQLAKYLSSLIFHLSDPSILPSLFKAQFHSCLQLPLTDLIVSRREETRTEWNLTWISSTEPS